MALTMTQVSKLYVAIFNRASEGEGNTFWQSSADMASAASAMLATTDAQAYFGDSLDSDQAFVEHIYLNTLNKTVEDDPDGIAHWVAMLEAGATRGEVVAALVESIDSYGPDGENYDPDDAATNAAYQQFMNRVEVSNYMAQTVEEPPADYAQSTSFSDGLPVTDDPDSVTSAKAAVDDLVPPPPVEPGETFYLTGAADRLTGTDKADIFEAYTGVNMLGNDTNTLNSADVLDGEAGRDQLWADIFMGSGNIGTLPRPIEFRSTEVEEMYFNAREMFMDGLVTGPLQMIPAALESFLGDDVDIDDFLAILPDQWQVVTVNGRQLLDVDYIESYYSDVDFKVLGLTTNQSDGGTTQFSDMTISMDHTSGSTANTQSLLLPKPFLPSPELWDFESKAYYVQHYLENGDFLGKLGYGYYIDGALKPSSMKVLFEQNYLIPGERAESQAIYYLLDQDADLRNTDINGDGVTDYLANINANGLRYTVDGGPAGVLTFDKQLLVDKQILNWGDFVDALQPALAQAIADGLLPADTTLTVDPTLTDFTFLDDGSRSVDIPAMVLETNTDAILDSVGFAWVEDLVGDYNVYGRLDNDAETAPEPLIINIELEKVGRQADGGGMVVGGDNYTKGFDQFDVWVKGEKIGYIDESSSLAYLLTTPHNGLDKMNIYTHPDYEDNPADLTIGNSNTPVYSILDVKHLDATDFLGILEIYYAVIQGAGNYVYELTDQSDVFQMFVTEDALNTTTSSLTIDAGTGDNIVAVDYLYSNGTVNDADDATPDSDMVNTLITTYGGDDIVALSNMGLEINRVVRPGGLDEDEDGAGDAGYVDISRADAAKIVTGAGNDAIFLNSHVDFCNPIAAKWHTLNWMGTGTEEWLTSIGLTNLPPWITEDNWAPAGDVFPFFGASMRVTFAGIESDWITIDTNNDYKTTRHELVAAFARAIETDVNLNHVFAVDVDPVTGGISLQLLSGGAFSDDDLFVDIEGPLPALRDYANYDWGDGAGTGYPDPSALFVPYFPGTDDVKQMTAQQLVSAWNAYYPGSDVKYDTATHDIENAGGGAPVYTSDAQSDWFGTPGSLTEFLAAVQANAEFTEDLINAALFDQIGDHDALDNDGAPASAGVQYVNAGSGHDTIVLPTGGITTVEFTGLFDTTTIISDGIITNLVFDFTNYLDIMSAGRGNSLNPALDLNLDNGKDVMDGFCPIPQVALFELDGVELADDWNEFGGGQHNSITYFDFSDLWSGLEGAFANLPDRTAPYDADEIDVLGNPAILPPNSFANFGAAQLESALNYWLEQDGAIREAVDYFDRNLAYENLDFDDDLTNPLADVVGNRFVILVGKDGEVIQEYDDGGATYPDPYINWNIDFGYANGEVKVFTGTIAYDSAEEEYYFDIIQEQGIINLGVDAAIVGNPEGEPFNWNLNGVDDVLFV